MANIKQTVKLGVFTLAIMNVTAVVSLRGLPAEAVYGMSSAFYYLFAAIVFLIPTSLVAAELAAMFQDKQGGVFRWVGGCILVIYKALLLFLMSMLVQLFVYVCNWRFLISNGQRNFSQATCRILQTGAVCLWNPTCSCEKYAGRC